MLLRLLLLLQFSGLLRAEVRLTLPPEIYAVPGVEMNVYFANTALIEPGTETNYRFRCECPVGSSDAIRWRLNATAGQVGVHPFRLSVLDKNGKTLQSASARVVVSPSTSGQGRSIRLLIIGDSLTHASHYPNEIARLLRQPGNPKWRMLGTHRPRAAEEGVAHEGYGGWTWARFRTRFEPTRPYPGKTNSSPFVFPDSENPKRGKLDVARYFETHCEGARPDFIIIMLGINDCFSARPDSPETIDPKIDAMFREAELLLKEFAAAAPKAQIGICLTTPGNARDEAFEANYKGRYPRWGWRRIQHRLVERQIRHFSGQPRLHLIPTQLNLDTLDGYPPNNAVHPNVAGYRQIGATIYAWLKSQL